LRLCVEFFENYGSHVSTRKVTSWNTRANITNFFHNSKRYKSIKCIMDYISG
jgi:hypothetical protein